MGDSSPWTVARLRETVDGRVLEPGDAGFEEACAVYLGGMDQRPVVVVQPADAADVAKVVLVAREHGVPIPARLAVLTDPAHVAALCASRDDELIPSACLNSTVSGLISRTVIRPDLLGADAFHGVCVYDAFADRDVSRAYVDTISGRFDAVAGEIDGALTRVAALAPADGRGMREVQAVQQEWGIESVHHVKPGIGETTRVLLRRVPRCVLVNPQHSGDRLDHVLLLAQERGVPVRERPGAVYACFGLIEP